MSLDKDIEKMTEKLKGHKRRFRIEAGNYGGELVVGQVDDAFVDYWIGKDESDLIDQIMSIEWEEDDGDPASPAVSEDFYAWHDCDNFEHLNGAYSDGTWTVYEVPADRSDDWSWDKEVWSGEPTHMFGRECYFDETSKPEDDDENIVPVLSFMSNEKGSFGAAFVDIEGEDFDPAKLRFGSVESNLADVVSNIFYDREELEIEFDYADTVGKSYSAQVGYLNKKWRDDPSVYTVEFLEEEGYFDE